MELRKRNKSIESFSKKKDDTYFIDKINILLNKIRIPNYSISDIPFIIISYFSIKGFRPLTQNEIIKYISNPTLFPSFSNYIHLRNEIVSALNNNNMFKTTKKKIKYELNLEKCYNYLNTYQETNINTGITNTDSNNNNSNYTPSLLNYPTVDNDVLYFNSDNQLNMSFNLEDDKNPLDNSFTFGEQSQIKMSNKKKSNTTNTKGQNQEMENYLNNNINVNSNINTEELENKALEKYIPEFEYVFDENKNFQILMKVASEFVINYKKININQKSNNKLEESLKKINSKINDINSKVEPFNKMSSTFNEVKNELFNANSVIHQQLNLMKIIAENDFLQKGIYNSEKELYMFYQDVYKKLLNKLQEDYNEIKNMEKVINNIIIDLKSMLNKISDEFIFKLNENNTRFYNLIIDITKNRSIPINVNINDTLKLFYSYIADFENLFSKVEEKVKEKKQKK